MIRAAEAGLHVLCEKPLATSVRDCERMIDACERNNVRLMTAYRLHFERCNLEVARPGAQEAHRRGTLLRFAVLDAGEGRQHPPRARAGRRTGMGHRHLLPERRALRVCRRAHAGVGHGHELRRCAVRGSSRDRARHPEISRRAHRQFHLQFRRRRSLALRDRRHQRQRGRAIPPTNTPKAWATSSRSARRRRRRSSPRATSSRPSSSISRNACAPSSTPEPSGKEGLIDVAIIEAIHESMASGQWVELSTTPRKQHRPTLRQEIRRPAVPREPPMVQAESGHS